MRKLAIPLSESRKNPKIEEAAVFVEKLFGRPMKSDPGILTVTEENRDAFIECIKADFPKRGVLFIPLSAILPAGYKKRVLMELSRDLVVEEPVIIGTGDLLRPLHTYRRCMQSDYSTNSKRIMLEEIAGIDRRTFYERMRAGLTAGVHMTGEKLIVTYQSEDPVTLVHELIHAEDAVELKPTDPSFDKLIHEGRATFGEHLFVLIGDGKYGTPRPLELEYLPWVLKAMAQNTGKELRGIIRKNGVASTAADISKFFSAVFAVTTITRQLHYLPYAIRLFSLSREVGNAFSAFQLATRKPPATRDEMRNPLEFYSREIEELKA